MSKSVMTRLLVVAAVIIAVAVGFFYGYAYLLTRRAEFIVRTSYELSQQKQLPTLSDIRERFGNALKQVDGCTASDCAFEVQLSNRPLAVMRLAPYTELKSYFSVRDGVVLGNMLDYTTVVNHRYSIVSHVQIDFCEERCSWLYLHPWGKSAALETNGLVEVGFKSSTRSKQTALGLNLSCMTTLGGCSNVAALLPTVWQRTGVKISCLVPNTTGTADIAQLP